MSLLLPTVNRTPHLSLPPPYNTSIAATSSQNQRGSMFNKLSKRLSIRSSKPQPESSDKTSKLGKGGLPVPASNNPFTTGSPATRRPNAPVNNNLTPLVGAPPAYTAPTASQAAAIITASDNDEYAFLRSFDTIFLIDDSGSMAGSLWQQTESALKMIAPICAERDEDGVDVWFLNEKKVWRNQRTAGNIIEIFQEAKPCGRTYTGSRLWAILKPYLALLQKHPNEVKPVNIIVITDGQAQDDVCGVIENVAKKLDQLDAEPWQVGIQFFQIGNDAGAREMLKQLDDGLADMGNMRDIVDTVPFTSENGGQLTGAGIMKVVLGSVNRRVDRSSKDLHR